MMDEPTERAAPQWNLTRSAKAKNAVQRCVTALLDELAPERVLKRVEALKGEVEQHRTPSGCVLQAETCAVSVSWFPEASKEAELGELHILVWQGKVTRRGGTGRAAKNARLVEELVVRPDESSTDDCRWIGQGGERHDTASLAARCLSLLAAQVDDTA